MAQKPMLRGEVGARALRVRCAFGQMNKTYQTDKFSRSGLRTGPLV